MPERTRSGNWKPMETVCWCRSRAANRRLWLGCRERGNDKARL